MKYMLIFILLVGCAVNEQNIINDPDIDIQQSSAIKIISVEKNETSAKVIVAFFVPNPCYEYYKYEEVNNKIYVYSKNQKTTMCIQVVSSFTKEFILTVDENNKIPFSFWVNDSTFLKVD